MSYVSFYPFTARYPKIYTKFLLFLYVFKNLKNKNNKNDSLSLLLPSSSSSATHITLGFNTKNGVAGAETPLRLAYPIPKYAKISHTVIRLSHFQSLWHKYLFGS
jgi:hypothetical protein